MLQKISTELKPALACLRRGYGVAQRSVICAFAAGAGFEIVAELGMAFDAAGIEALPAATLVHLTELLTRIDLSAVHAVIVGSAGLLSDIPLERVVVYSRLRQRGVELIAADDPGHFEAECRAYPDIAEALAISARFDDAAGLAEPRATASAQRARTGNQHRRTYAELEPAATLMAKRLFQTSRQSGERITLRAISAQLAAAGFTKADGGNFHPEAIRRMLKGKWPRNGAPK